MILLLTLLFIKHFVCDFLYQPPYMWQNKGTLGHWGGIAHSLFHAVVTALLLLYFAPSLIWLSVVEFVIHYFTDYFKMNINKKYKWAANTHNEFWILLGVDQLIHSLTYVGIVAAVASSL